MSTGNKYRRVIRSIDDPFQSVVTDVYGVIVGFDVTNPATAHAIKKLLCAGLRGKGGAVQDLTESIDAVKRAIEIEKTKNRSIDDGTHDPKWLYVPDIDKEGEWGVYPVIVDKLQHDGLPQVNEIIGYRVGWTKRDEQGRMLLVRHYMSGPEPLQHLPNVVPLFSATPKSREFSTARRHKFVCRRACSRGSRTGIGGSIAAEAVRSLASS